MRWTLAASGGFCPLDENAESVRRNRVVLAPRPWRLSGPVCGLGNGGKKGRSPGRVRISRSQLRGEGRDVLAVPVGPCAFLSTHCTRSSRVPAGARPSLRPLLKKGPTKLANLGQIVSRERAPLFPRHCEERSDEAIQLPFSRQQRKLDCFASLAMTGRE